MSGRSLPWITSVLCAGLLAVAPLWPGTAWAFEDDDERIGFEITPPRLALAEGEVSLLRPGAGADEWTEAPVNLALAAGDELYAAEGARFELQVGARGYLRAGGDTQLGLASLEPDYLQVRVAIGRVSLDLRGLEPGQTFELATPNAAFTIERSGYYRLEVEGDETTFASRRGGLATLTTARRVPTEVRGSEQVVVSGFGAAQVETTAVPKLDAFDRWNYARTDSQLDPSSARYVPSGIYGVGDLDRYGDWRVVGTYGPVWIPRRVAAGWAPYSTGRWSHDPFYGWTWVDTAPWGWAPYHYGRWVRVSSRWAWAPGPRVVRPYYAPALVAFIGHGGLSIGVALDAPYRSWVALSWGEPLVPWWGSTRYRGVPRWAGWGGPRIVNHVVVNRTRVVHAREIKAYANLRVRNGRVAARRDSFARRYVARGPEKRIATKRHEHRRATPRLEPAQARRGIVDRPARRPARAVVERPALVTREQRATRRPDFASRPPTSRAKPREARVRERRDREAKAADRPLRSPVRAVTPRENRAAETPRGSRRSAAERRSESPPVRLRNVEGETRRIRPERASPERRVPPPAAAVRRPERRAEVPRNAAQLRARAVRESADPSQSGGSRKARRSEQRIRAFRELPGRPADRVHQGAARRRR